MELVRDWWRERQARQRIRRITHERIIAELSLLEQRIRRLERVRNREAAEQLTSGFQLSEPHRIRQDRRFCQHSGLELPADSGRIEGREFGGGDECQT